MKKVLTLNSTLLMIFSAIAQEKEITLNGNVKVVLPKFEVMGNVL